MAADFVDGITAYNNAISNRLLLSSPTRAKIKATKISGPPDTIGTVYSYKNLAVNMVNGTELIDFPRCSRVKVWADDVHWRWWTEAEYLALRPDGLRDAAGASILAPAGWRWPGRPMMGIVMYQDNGTFAETLTGTNQARAQDLQIDNGYSVIFGVNDGSTVPTGYDDNTGAFSVSVQILQK